MYLAACRSNRESLLSVIGHLRDEFFFLMSWSADIAHAERTLRR